MKKSLKRRKKSSAERKATREARCAHRLKFPDRPIRPRQPVTPVGLVKRLEEAKLGGFVDTRSALLVRYSASGLLNALVLGLATATRSMRGIENLVRWMPMAIRRLIGLSGPVSDTRLHDFMGLLTLSDIDDALPSLVKAEWGRGNLKPVCDMPCSVVGLDGKQCIAYTDKQLWALYHKEQGPRPDGFTVRNLVLWLKVRFPLLQVVRESDRHQKDPAALTDEYCGKLHGLMRSLRLTLVSNPAAPCIAVEMIPGDKNEVGFAPEVLRRTFKQYAKTLIMGMITADAGNCSELIANTILEHGSHYFLAIKLNQPGAYAEAERLLGLTTRNPDYSGRREVEQGLRAVRNVWVADARELLERFGKATQLVRVDRDLCTKEGVLVSRETRYFVTSMPTEQLDARQAGAVARAHWNCENLGHWTSDAHFHEDNGARTPLTRHPDGVPVVTVLRLLAQSIVSILRAITRGRTAKAPLPSWAEVSLQVYRALWGGVRIRTTNESVAFAA